MAGRNRRLFFIDRGRYMGEFPPDLDKGWQNERRGLRRALAKVEDLAHLSDAELERELEKRWYRKEREIREEQSQAFQQEEIEARKLKRMKVMEAVAKWSIALSVTNSERIQKQYLSSLKHYVKAVGDHELGKYQKFFETNFKAYLQTCTSKTGKPFSATTQNKHIRHVNVFFTWAYEHDLIHKAIKLSGLRIPRKDMETLEIEDLDKAIEYAANKANAATTRTERMRYKSLERAMMIARHTILRAGAIWSLKLENIDLKNRIIKIQEVPEIGWKPKALKYPRKPINDALYEYLKKDLEERDESEIWYLDYGEGKQWRRDDGNLSREAAKLFKEMEYPAIKPFHEGFRSTLITHMLVSGVPITTVQQLADHSSIKTTESYLDRRRIQQEQAVEALNNINKPPSE